MANIFQISQDLLTVIQELEDNGGELTDDLEAKLVVSQTDFKTKLKSYGDAIKYTKNDIELIDKEIDRLKSLKESKKKTVVRLEKIIVWAIGMFGEETKSGGKYVDYGTGKISIRNTKKVEINTDVTDAVVKNVFDYFSYLERTKELEYLDSIDCKDIVDALKVMDNPVNITEDELSVIQASLTLDVNIKDLLYNEGVEFTRTLLKLVQSYKAKSNLSKTALKPMLEKDDVNLSHIASLVENKTITMK